MYIDINTWILIYKYIHIYRLPHLAAKLARIEAQQGGLSKMIRQQVY